LDSDDDDHRTTRADAELWHCDRHFELIAEVTGQPMRRVGT